MKQIEVKTHETIEVQEGEKLTYKHLINIIINKQPAGGFTYKDNKLRAKIEDAVKDEKAGLITMEDEPFDELLKLAKDMTWGFRSTFTNDFLDDLTAAKSVKPLTVEEIKHSSNGQAKEVEAVK